MLKKIFLFFGAFTIIFSGFGLVSPVSASTTALADLEAGSLVRGQSLSAVYYYAKDGFRYVFPNDKTYFTWYQNFDTVKWLSDADLGKIQIGGNVTYRPGVKMIKINSDPKTYAVGENGSLHWVSTEAAAISLYGSNWNTKIDDVPDGFFSNYTMSSDIEDSSDFVPADETATATSIDSDKGLLSPVIVVITDSGYSDTTINTETDRAVKFTNNGSSKHSATAEDLSWGTGTLNSGDSFTRYFRTADTYDFFCSYHASETGTITVE